jgi:hypothetical protein
MALLVASSLYCQTRALPFEKIRIRPLYSFQAFIGLLKNGMTLHSRGAGAIILVNDTLKLGMKGF